MVVIKVKFKKSAPAIFNIIGTERIINVFCKLFDKLLAISNSSHKWDRLPSIKLIWARSVAMEAAPFKEIDTLAFLMAIYWGVVA